MPLRSRRLVGVVTWVLRAPPPEGNLPYFFPRDTKNKFGDQDTFCKPSCWASIKACRKLVRTIKISICITVLVGTIYIKSLHDPRLQCFGSTQGIQSLDFQRLCSLDIFCGLPNEPIFSGGTPKALKEAFKAARSMGIKNRDPQKCTIKHVILCSESSGCSTPKLRQLPTDGRLKKIRVSDFKASRLVRDFVFHPENVDHINVKSNAFIPIKELDHIFDVHLGL